MNVETKEEKVLEFSNLCRSKITSHKYRELAFSERVVYVFDKIAITKFSKKII